MKREDKISPVKHCNVTAPSFFHEIDPVPFRTRSATPIQCFFPPVTEAPRKLQVLSEIAADLAVDLSNPKTQKPLFCYLENVAAETVGAGGSLAFGTLVVDEPWRITQPVRIPPGFTLAGVGVGGAGAIIAVEGFTGEAAIVLREDVGPARRVTIRDLRVEVDEFLGNSLPTGQPAPIAGIKFSGAENSYVQNVLVANYTVGLFCSRSISNWISNCVFFANGDNVVFFRGNFNNHLRDCFIRFARCWGVRCFGAANGPDPFEGLLENNGWGNDFQFDGCDIEQNSVGGILANGFATRISACRFENNGSFSILIELGPCPEGSVGPDGTFEASGEVKIIGNLISGRQIAARFPAQKPDTIERSAWPNGYGLEAAFNMGNTEGDANHIEPQGV